MSLSANNEQPSGPIALVHKIADKLGIAPSDKSDENQVRSSSAPHTQKQDDPFGNLTGRPDDDPKIADKIKNTFGTAPSSQAGGQARLNDLTSKDPSCILPRAEVNNLPNVGILDYNAGVVLGDHNRQGRSASN